MIKAKHNLLAENIYRAYVSHLLKSSFSKFILLNELPSLDKEKGLIITPNHFSWWDGFFAGYLMRSFTKRRPYLMMLEKQLRQYWFFKYAGAFSIDTSAGRHIKESMAYAKDVSLSPDNYLIFYPQGEIQQHEKEYVKLKKGIIHLANGIDANVLIVSFKIAYNEEKRPSVYCRFGNLISAKSVRENYDRFENSFLENIEMINTELHTVAGSDLFKR